MDVFYVQRILDRLGDINKRGYNCLVYDYDNSVVQLKNSRIWYNNDKYVEPKLYQKDIEEKKENTIKCCFFC